MRSFQDTFATRKRSFISVFPICITVPLRREGRQMPNAEQLLYQTEKPLPEVFNKKAILKNFAIFTGKNLLKFLRTPILNNIYVRLLLN